MNPVNLLDPKLGAYARLALKILTLAAVIVAAVAGSFPQLAWVASVSGALSVVISGLTHLTSLGNKPASDGGSA